MTSKTFHGWWMVAGCMAVAIVAWSFALYGPSVYLHTISQTHDWSIGLVSSALTLSFLFALMGLGWSCLSTTAITSSLAPWFERHQGRAVSTAMLGASIGGMVGVPTLLALIAWLGFNAAILVVALIVLTTVWSVSFFILRHRPQDLGLYPDGEPPAPQAGKPAARTWSRTEALRTLALRSVALTFGLALMVQIGFLTHQVSLLLPALGQAATAVCVTAAAMLAFVGRILLAKFSDRLDVRQIAFAVLLTAGASLVQLPLVPSSESRQC